MGTVMAETVLILDRTVDAPRQARDHVRALGVERKEDATLLVSELVTNAVKYGPEDGEIRLIIDQNDTRTRFTVHDPGAGPLLPSDRAVALWRASADDPPRDRP